MRAGDMRDPGADTPTMMIHWQLVWVTQINTHTRISDRTNNSIFQSLDKILKYCVTMAVFSISRLCHNCLSLSQPRHFIPRPSVTLQPQIVKCSQITIFLSHSKSQNKANQVSQITATQTKHSKLEYYISPAPANPRMLQVIHDWILLLIAIHLCNLFPWLPLDSPHFARDIPPSSDVFVVSRCPVNHQPSPSAIHR